MSDVEDANKIATTFPALDGWRDRAAVPFRPQPGSELHADDQDWPGMPVTQVAASSMAAAVDHLQAFRISLSSGSSSPSPTPPCSEPPCCQPPKPYGCSPLMRPPSG